MSTTVDYETDLYAWTQRQADALRRRAGNEIDYENIAEEIETLGRSERHEIQSRLDTLVLHLIKLHAKPDHLAARKWSGTVFEQRRQLMQRIEDSPSLRSLPALKLPETYAAMRKRALMLGFADIPEACPWPIGDVLAEDFLP